MNIKTNLFAIICSLSVFVKAEVTNQDFVSIVKKTRSAYVGNSDIDAENYAEILFENTLSNQRLFFRLSADKLNSTAFTLINSGSSLVKNTMEPPVVHVYNLGFDLDNQATLPGSCDGHDVTSGATDCGVLACTVKQRIISQCNADDCWDVNPSADRELVSNISESFSMQSEIEISDCLTNNISGQKHSLKITSENESTSLLRGGTVSYSLSLQNDVF